MRRAGGAEPVKEEFDYPMLLALLGKLAGFRYDSSRDLEAGEVSPDDFR